MAFALAAKAADEPPPPEPPCTELDRVVDAAGLRLHLHCDEEGRVSPFDAIELELELLWGERFDPSAARGREE